MQGCPLSRDPQSPHPPQDAPFQTTQVDLHRPSVETFESLQTPAIGLHIDHFRVLRQIGVGGMGRVLLARDTRLGRLVALKLIREDRLDGEGIVALMAEARLTARVSHPNIVTIHHIGRWGKSPYLALEYISGTSLRERLVSSPPTQREALRIALSIARALEAAHAARIVHCDLKPENVLLPSDGRLRVVDFGIGHVVETMTTGPREPGQGHVAGTPGYMAPEQWRGETPSEAADLWAMGMILYEMLAGYRPFEGPAGDGRPMHMRVLDEATVIRPISGIPNDLQHLVSALCERDPLKRPHAGAVARQLEAMLARDDGDSRVADAPFRGLLPFEERHAGFFFGRDAEVDAAVERLRTATVMPIVGPSGAGKSSFVQAGLLPRVREQGPWTIVTLRPGARPLTALASRLLHQDTADPRRPTNPPRDQVDELARQLLEEPTQANVRLHLLAEQNHTRLLLFVDQLEEVVTHGCPPAEAAAFLTAIAGAADPVDDVLRVVFTLRDDFLARVAGGEAMAAALAQVVVLRRLDDRHLREAATRPLERLGYTWDDPSVIDRIVAELSGLPAALPLLQFAGAALWERRDRQAHRLLRAEYEAIGGVAGALAAHAEAVFEGLSPADVAVARRLLLRLVAIDGTRRALQRQAALDGLGPRAEVVLERLTAARLLTVRRSRVAQDDAVLELAHESLLRTWPQLVRWLEESSEERLAAAEVEEAARLWASRGKPLAEVWPLDGIADARRRLRAEAASLSQNAKDFLENGETAGLARRSKTRWLMVAGLALAALVTTASLVTAAELARRERTTQAQAAQIALAAADTGLAQLELELVDRDARTGQVRPVDAAQFAQLKVTVLDADPRDAHRPGAVRDPRFVHLGPPQVVNGRWTTSLETRSGTAFLQVAGRGRDGQRCAPSLLHLRSLPGYVERNRGPVALRATVPTCAATAEDTVEIPAGPFIFGGEGEPPIPSRLPTTPEKQLNLPTFWLDRSEVPNAWYAVYARNEPLTGEGVPDYPPEDVVHDAAKADHPVSALDAYAAEAFCAWQGKRLPTTEEWTKAARGGLTLDAAGRLVNPLPRRNFPWGIDMAPNRVNLGDRGDAWPASAPTISMPEGASPYGILHMADNVSEWTATTPRESRGSSLRLMRGGDWFTPSVDGVHSISGENERNPRYFALALGVRCAW